MTNAFSIPIHLDFSDSMLPHVSSIFGGEYDFERVELSPKSILDIGANEGAFTAWAESKWPDAVIHSYEPNPSSFRRLERNAHRGMTYPFGVTRDGRGLSMRMGKHNSGECSIHDLGDQSDALMECRSISASSLPNCDLVKIDTEGCELEILEHLNLAETRAVALECHRDSDREQIASLLASRGFTLHSSRILGKSNFLMKFLRSKSIEELKVKPKKVFIGIPIYGQVDPNFFKCCMKLASEFSVNASIFPYIGDSLIPRARNAITARFLESDCTHLLMIDSDLVFSNDQIRRILSHDEDVVSGLYPKKQEGKPQMVCNTLDAPGIHTADGMLQIKYAGTGFILVARHVFGEMIAKYGDELGYEPDQQKGRKEWDFWSVGVYKYPDGKKRYLSEDWYFCQRALDLGFSVWADTQILLKHSGAAVYPLSYQEKEILSDSMSASSDDSASEPVKITCH